jgi:branched-chain amino acid transport system substrate-binding protein
MKRRDFLASGAGAGSIALAGAAAEAQAQTVKVGFIATFSGGGASIGDLMIKSARLYQKLHDKDLPSGVKVELIQRDDGGPNPDVAKRLATELVTRDKVQFITGLIYTPNAMAIAELATEAKVPTVIMNAGTSVIMRRSPYFVRTSFTMWQSAYPLGQWAAKQGMKRGYTAVADYGPGHDIEAAFDKGFTEAGGTMIGKVRMPLSVVDFAPFMQRIKDEKPDVLCIFVPAGKVATAIMKSYNDLGLAQAGVRLIGPGDITPDEELPNMDVPSGIVTTMHHYSAASTRPQNVAFVNAWKAEYGANSTPSFYSVGAWDGMAAIYHAVKQQNGQIDADRTIALLKGWQNPDSPRGPITIDAETRDIVQNLYLRRLERVDGQLRNIEVENLGPIKDPWVRFNPPR